MMTHLSSNQQKQSLQLQLRRSQRKRIKKINEQDFITPIKVKKKVNKNFIHSLPTKISNQIEKQLLINSNDKQDKVLNFKTKQFNQEILNLMKKSVNQQENKLYQISSINLMKYKSFKQRINNNMNSDNKILNSRHLTEKKQKISQNCNQQQQQQKYAYKHKSQHFIRMATTDQLYCPSLSLYQNQEQIDQLSSFISEQSIFLQQIPLFRKQSSKLLADNYQKLQLQYTIDHMIPDQYKEEYMINQQQQN